MAGKKFYGVKFNDGSTKIFTDWSVCKEMIKGEKGVLYKGFKTRDEALFFVGYKSDKMVEENSFQTDIAIYVDGSYRDEVYSYGFVVVDLVRNVGIYEQKGRGTDEEAAKLRNVSGEMKGAMEAMAYCLNNNIKEATICYDYTGIEMWALGLWKRNNIYTQRYYDFFQSRKDRLTIYFKKIKGHSGDIWNERADILAKEGLDEF
ncbi:MAG: ribonuclease H family protein [Firmicutes bacterium]|nr:ribonuclease H family protein [Bacillota bacterium]